MQKRRKSETGPFHRFFIKAQMLRRECLSSGPSSTASQLWDYGRLFDPFLPTFPHRLNRESQYIPHSVVQVALVIHYLVVDGIFIQFPF